MDNRDFLISLLEDEDDANASIAMKELLDAYDVQAVIAENMDTDSPLMRKRIHELACLDNRRRLKNDLPKQILENSLTPWEFLARVNTIIDFRTSLPQLEDMVRDYLDDPLPEVRNIADFIAFIKDTGLGIDDSNDFFITKFLPSDVLVHNTGDRMTVAIILQHLGHLLGWDTVIGVLDGFVCLRGKNADVVVITSEMDKVAPNSGELRCLTLREVAIDELSKILSSACIDQIASVMLDIQEILEKIL